MFLDKPQDNSNTARNTGRTNDDLNERDDLMYSHTFKTGAGKGGPDDLMYSNTFKSGKEFLSQNTAGKDQNTKRSQESLFERDSAAVESFNNASTYKGKKMINVEEMDPPSTGREVDFDLTKAGEVGYNQTATTKNSKSEKHVSFK